MNKLINVMIPVFTCCAMIVGLICWSARSFPSSSGQLQPAFSQEAQGLPAFNLIDEKAQALRGSDEVPIRELTDALFSMFGASEAPHGVVDSFKQHFIRSEINYRNGSKAGIPEENIVRVVNQLAQKFNAPDYARTSPEEVRRLRMIEASLLPHFITQEGTKGRDRNLKEGSLFSSTMSPLEAGYITATLIHQKLYNEEFQVTPQERADNAAKRNQGNPEKGPYLSGSSSARYREMQAVLRRALAASPDDLLVLGDRSLDTLGIDR